MRESKRAELMGRYERRHCWTSKIWKKEERGGRGRGKGKVYMYMSAVWKGDVCQR
jgi:hypothetical protein